MKNSKIIGVITFLFIGSLFFSQCSNNKMLETMKKEAATINTQCPVMLDEITRLDGCEVIPPRTFRYNYTSLASNNSDTVSMKERIEPQMVKNIKNQIVMEPYRKEGVIFQYFYKDQSGNHLFRIDIGPDKYNK